MTRPGRTPLRLAHRGDWRAAPENTILAMRAALAVPGCDGLEFDIRAAADGTPVLLHDPTLDRVQGIAAAVGSMTVEALAAHGIPTLAEVLAAVGREPFLDVEVKGPPVPALLDVLDAARGGGGGREGGGPSTDATLYRAVVSSFEAVTLAWLTLRRPAWPRWLNALDLAPSTLAVASELGCSGVAVTWRAIDAAGIARARAAGLEIVGWTVRRRDTFQRLARLGVHAICVEGPALDG